MHPPWNYPGWDVDACFVATNGCPWLPFLQNTCPHPWTDSTKLMVLPPHHENSLLYKTPTQKKVSLNQDGGNIRFVEVCVWRNDKPNGPGRNDWTLGESKGSIAIAIFSLQKLGVKISEGSFLKHHHSTKVRCKISNNDFSTKIGSLYETPWSWPTFSKSISTKKTVCSCRWPHQFRRRNFKGDVNANHVKSNWKLHVNVEASHVETIWNNETQYGIRQMQHKMP